MNRELVKEYIGHHLSLVGLGRRDQEHVFLMASPEGWDIAAAIEAAATGVVVAILPERSFLSRLGVSESATAAPPASLRYGAGTNSAARELRTLHPFCSYSHSHGQAIVVSQDGEAVWLWVPAERGGILIVGTDIAGDLLRYRQGDPTCASNRPTEAKWGIAGERPNYLFDEQLAGEDGLARHADWWAMALAEAVAEKLGRPLMDILPGGAPGAILITGDDDQAYLEKYDEQLTLLGDTPITYLLHPLTRHTSQTVRAMQRRNHAVDFGIHPDALEAPERYNDLFEEQVAWYRSLMDQSPISLRNHGFLNDGYWGHLDAWLKHDVGISSNLPGFDGRILNGSLLPARMAWKGALSGHWSVLTAIGDGVRFVSGMSDQDAADRVWSIANRIKESMLPGVIVLNLHPQNVSETRAMHLAAKEIIRSGFVGWNLRQCLSWFQQVDAGSALDPAQNPASWIARRWRHLWGRVSGLAAP